jgi:hypothetical protein
MSLNAVPAAPAGDSLEDLQRRLDHKMKEMLDGIQRKTVRNLCELWYLCKPT